MGRNNDQVGIEVPGRFHNLVRSQTGAHDRVDGGRFERLLCGQGLQSVLRILEILLYIIQIWRDLGKGGDGRFLHDMQKGNLAAKVLREAGRVANRLAGRIGEVYRNEDFFQLNDRRGWAA